MPPEFAELYRVEKLEWRGETAEIWRARTTDDELVAIKRLRLDKARDFAARRSLRHEARMALGLDHPNVVRVFEFVPGQPSPALVMEFFPSKNLKLRLLDRRGDPLLRSRLKDIMVQMAEALCYVHSQGIIHLDIKPENFLVSEDGQVKLTDFALAKRNPTWWQHLTPGIRRIAGTRSYIAPETLRRRLPDVRTDIYSFGVTLFELLTRRPPFISQDRDEVLRMHLREPPPWPVTFNKSLSMAMNQLILRMLEKDPGRRPQTMEDVAARLRRIAVYDKPPADQPAEEHAR